MIGAIVEKTSDGRSVRVTLTLETPNGKVALPPSDEFVAQIEAAVQSMIVPGPPRLGEVADELAANGMDSVADVLRRLGPRAALAEVEQEIAHLRLYPDSDQLTGNLEVARERLEELERPNDDR